MTTSSAGEPQPYLRCQRCGAFGVSYGEFGAAAIECPWCFSRRQGVAPVYHDELLKFLRGE